MAKPAAPKPVRADVGRVVTGVLQPSWFLVKCLIPVIMLAGLAFAVVYVRLLNGPISMAFLAAPISRSIAAELPGMSVAIEDALVRLTDGGRIEFRLRNVRFNDAEGAPVAIAPLAAVGISGNALWSGRLAPDTVVLIEPRLLVVYGEGTGLAMSYAKPAPTVETASGPPGALPVAADPSSIAAKPDDEGGALQQIDLGRMIAKAGLGARHGGNASSFLREIGVRNATIIVDRGGRQTVWSLIEGNIDLEHKKRRSIVTGSLSFASATGPWAASFKIEESEKANSVVLEAALRDLVPRGVATLAPDIPLLAMVDAPLFGQGRVELKPDGGVISAEVQLQLGRGTFMPAGLEGQPVAIDGGNLDVRYNAKLGHITLAPSTLQWNQGRATIVGSMTASDGSATGGKPHWAVDLQTTGGQLTSDDFPVAPVDITEAVLQGRYWPETGGFSLTQARLKAGGAQVDVAGEWGGTGGRHATRLDGRIGPVSGDVIKAAWPKFLVPDARTWIGRQVTRGRVTGAAFKVVLGGADRDAAATPPERRVSLTIEAADLAFAPAQGLATVEAPKALVRIENDSLEITLPDATSQVVTGRRIVIKSGRMTAVDFNDPRSQNEIAFRVQSPLGAAIDFLEQEAFGLGPLGIPSEGIDGKVEGQFKIGLPLYFYGDPNELKIEGKVKITDGRAKQAVGPHDVQSATVNIDIGDGAVNATGQMMVGGVNAKLSFQRILGATQDRQPPLRLTATLDAADRNQLGFDVNHIVSGDIPVDLTVTRGPRVEQQLRVRADLTGAELNIEPIAWRKATGRQALLEFDVVRTPKNGRTELQNFRVVGDDIAIDGAMAIDAKGRLTEFQFPNFALTLVSRVELQGALRPNDNVWDIKVRGQYWDGRDYFRRLFAIGQTPEKNAAPKKDQAGIELKADFDTVQGHGDIALKIMSLRMTQRAGRMTSLHVRGNVQGGKPIEVGLQQTSNDPRKLVVLTDDAGQAFRMVGFYPNMQGGVMRLEVNLDGRGAAEKTGLLDVRRFDILGDPVLSEVLQTSGEASREGIDGGRRQRRKVERQSIYFDEMQLPFSVGYNQFILEKDSQLRGPILGILIHGKVDFKTQRVDAVGSYLPLQAVNALPGILPMGQLLTGVKSEGVVGITFWATGPIAQPEVLINPLSAILPGPFRALAEMGPTSFRVVPRDEKPVDTKPGRARQPQSPGAGTAYRSTQTVRPRAGEAEPGSQRGVGGAAAEPKKR